MKKLFYHIYAVNDWFDILDEHLPLIKNIPFDKIWIGLANPNPCIHEINRKHSAIMDRFAGLPVEIHQVNPFTWEFDTISDLWHDAKPEDQICYIHSKGAVSGDGNPYIADWRSMMNYFVLENWETCVDLLEDNDTCGIMHLGDHYSGNFWWANGDFIRTLPNIYDEAPHDRILAEFWFARADWRGCCLHNSRVHHYTQPYSDDNYRGVPIESTSHFRQGTPPPAED